MVDKIKEEIEALRWLAAANPDDALAQASIAGQINVLEWVEWIGTFSYPTTSSSSAVDTRAT